MIDSSLLTIVYFWPCPQLALQHRPVHAIPQFSLNWL